MDKSAYVFCFTLLITGTLALDVIISSNGPAVRGANVTFTATVIDYDGEKLKFSFWDNAVPQHQQEFILSSNISQWVVSYPRELYESGQYVAYVQLSKKAFINMFWVPVGESAVNFLLTENLIGNLTLTQNKIERTNNFVAVNQTVEHGIQLSWSDLMFLKENASSIVTYWYIDCSYIIPTVDFKFTYTYTDLMGNHRIDAVVVANTLPLPPLTTTSTTTTTTTTSTTTTTTTTTTPKPTTASSTSAPTTSESPKIPNQNDSKKVVKREAQDAGSQLGDFICDKNNIIPIDSSYIYGHFQQNISVREPVNGVNITGLNWLQHGDLLNLQVKYSGSPPFVYCAQYKEGEYNITGNETCAMKYNTMSNQFPLLHYFSSSDQHTVVVIIENDVWKEVQRATINIYKVSPHPQLSVIVVPVIFCLVAVILVVFGVAYYIQHRSRHTVEVADFDFGQQAHLDYKTFVERLRDSFSNTVNFGKHDDTEALTGPSNGYDSRT